MLSMAQGKDRFGSDLNMDPGILDGVIFGICVYTSIIIRLLGQNTGHSHNSAYNISKVDQVPSKNLPHEEKGPVYERLGRGR